MPLGEVGEIWITSVQNMKGYWNLPEETAKSLRADGWFRTGDAGYLDADGYVYIHDRVKDMIVSGGENIYPAEIENVLMAHPAVGRRRGDRRAVASEWGETPKAIVVQAAGADPTRRRADRLLPHAAGPLQVPDLGRLRRRRSRATRAARS